MVSGFGLTEKDGHVYNESMEMLKLLIVDDEKIILKGLVETYDWKGIGFEVVGAALDGQEALELMKELRPDVVLTDICMKCMDGIQLMEETKKIDPEIRFVVLSAYRDFDYAQEACRLGAVSYLLKPITDEMFAKMQEVYELCRKEKEEHRNYRKWEKFLVQDEKSFFSYMLERFLRGEISEKELLEISDAVERRFKKGSYFAAICADVNAVYKITEQKEYSEKRFALDTYIKEQLKEFQEFWDFVNTDGSHIYIVNMGERISTGKLKLILAGIPKAAGFEITSALTNAYPGLEGLHRAYEQVQHLFDLANEEEVGLLEEAAGLEGRKEKGYPTEAENRIILGIRRCDREQVKRGCIEFIEVLSEDEDTNKILLRQLAVRVESMLNTSYGLEEEVRKGFDEYYRMFFRYPASRLMYLLHELFCLIVEKRMQMVPAGEEEKYTSYIRNACNFMKEHMMEEELAIIQVAESVYLNPVYFGRVFKAVMGMSFKQYLLQIRMERAKQLLLDTSMTVTDICQEVGIPNASYFAKLFKQYTGTLPSEYKR